ncbi:MAG: methyltransferase, TIGR04290 family [Deltaproteobacteria bacterium GWA2_54_12]|nr:MAG: methyltransferase, TIGR04290 family [Deltaproteobacteria bacterium GWA2_54_12]
MDAEGLTTKMIREKAVELGPWFQNINLRGIETAPEHFLGDYPSIKWMKFADAVPADLGGMSVLDIGCNAGFYCIEMKKRGAASVLGIDTEELYLNQARFAARVLGFDVEFMRMSVYDIAELDRKFDLILFMGVLYHLRYPLLALDLIYEHAAAGLLVFQSMLRGANGAEAVADDYPFSETSVFDRPAFPRLHFIEKSYSGDDTNWWLPNKACAEAMLRSSGFDILSNPEKEVFICRKGERRWCGQ